MGRLFWRYFLTMSAGAVLGAVLVSAFIHLTLAIDPGLAADGWRDPWSTTATRPAWWPPVLGMLVSSAIVGAFLSWKISRPIRLLSWGLEELSRGHLETRLAESMPGPHDELGRLGQEFDGMAARLQSLVGAQQRLLHDVSHELRSPLARLQGAIGIARQQPARWADMLDRIERESERLDALVGELLTLARLESGNHRTGFSALDVIALVESVCEDANFEALAAGRQVHFNAACAYETGADEDLLRRAVENVVRNAVKFTREGTAVWVSARIEEQALLIAVADQGPGVPAADVGQMFEPFKRLGAATTPGFGLGLSIAKRAVELHGGTISAVSPEGGGLVVTIRLPSHSAHSAHTRAVAG